ncbi:MAG: hypothetical protein DCC68_18950 [Planctomycetota bacterium]|nr:MAG: hypothetical protein DCC68_18950 [Planctomycetota bacterium]
MPDSPAFRKVRAAFPTPCARVSWILIADGAIGPFGPLTAGRCFLGDPTMTEPAPDLVNVGSFVTINDAEFARMLLESEGIEAYIADATIVSMDWLLGNAIGWIKVQVSAADEPRAREILAQWQRELRERPPASESDAIPCLECGKEMPLGVATCPECGWTYLGGQGD